MCTKSCLIPKFIFALAPLFVFTLMVVSVAAQQALGFTITYDGRVYDSISDQTTFTYIVSGTGVPPDLSHFDLEIPTCPVPLIVVSYSPTSAVSFGIDPTTGINGIKWDVPLLTTDTRTYSITFEGNVVEGAILAAVKGGPGFEARTVPGPSCVNPSISVKKFVSVDGVTWHDADTTPGPDAELNTQVLFHLIITNDGNVPLNNITLFDSVFDTSSCILPETLAVGVFFDCTVGPFDVVEGQHTNVATATGDYEGTTVSDTDSANYFGGDRPAINVAKLISANDGASWVNSTQVSAGTDVSFRFIITNTGNVVLTNLTLADSAFDTGECNLPPTLEPNASVECIIGPFPAGDTAHINTASVSADFGDETVTDTNTASYQPVDDEELDITVVIEGPVQAVNLNIIVIFGIEIELDPGNPILNQIRIGDIIRVEGDIVGDGSIIVIVAVNVTIINLHITTISQPAPSLIVPGIPIIPAGCKITGIGNNNPRLKCSGR